MALRDRRREGSVEWRIEPTIRSGPVYAAPGRGRRPGSVVAERRHRSAPSATCWNRATRSPGSTSRPPCAFAAWTWARWRPSNSARTTRGRSWCGWRCAPIRRSPRHLCEARRTGRHRPCLRHSSTNDGNKPERLSADDSSARIPVRPSFIDEAVGRRQGLVVDVRQVAARVNTLLSDANQAAADTHAHGARGCHQPGQRAGAQDRSRAAQRAGP